MSVKLVSTHLKKLYVNDTNFKFQNILWWCRYHENKPMSKFCQIFLLCIWCILSCDHPRCYNIYLNRKNRNGRETNVQTVFIYSVSQNVQDEFYKRKKEYFLDFRLLIFSNACCIRISGRIDFCNWIWNHYLHLIKRNN